MCPLAAKMPSTSVEYALKKQRLQLESDQLRGQMSGYAQGLKPACHTVDLFADGVRCLARRPLVPVAIAVAVVVSRPRMLWRWARRAYSGWSMWRRWQRIVTPTSTP
jgi:hypothetical protein